MYKNEFCSLKCTKMNFARLSEQKLNFARLRFLSLSKQASKQAIKQAQSHTRNFPNIDQGFGRLSSVRDLAILTPLGPKSCYPNHPSGPKNAKISSPQGQKIFEKFVVFIKMKSFIISSIKTYDLTENS